MIKIDKDTSFDKHSFFVRAALKYFGFEPDEVASIKIKPGDELWIGYDCANYYGSGHVKYKAQVMGEVEVLEEDVDDNGFRKVYYNKLKVKGPCSIYAFKYAKPGGGAGMAIYSTYELNDLLTKGVKPWK